MSHAWILVWKEAFSSSSDYEQVPTHSYVTGIEEESSYMPEYKLSLSVVNPRLGSFAQGIVLSTANREREALPTNRLGVSKFISREAMYVYVCGSTDCFIPFYSFVRSSSIPKEGGCPTLPQSAVYFLPPPLVYDEYPVPLL